jgi:hypothetical protein
MAERISNKMIAELEAGAQEEFALAAPSRRGGPALSGRELMSFLADKVVIPLVCAFAVEPLYRAYKLIRSPKQAEQAKKDVEGQELKQSPVISVEMLIAEVVAELKLEGVNAELAERVVGATVERIKVMAVSQTPPRDNG